MNENHANLLPHLLAISKLISQCIDCLQEGEDADHPKEASIIPSSAPHDLKSAEMPSGVLEQPSLPTDLAAVPQATLRKALAEKSLAGYAEEVRALIKKHGASSLNSVDPSHYADMLREVAEIGGTNHD